jgi:hypothetical protein
MRNKEGCNPPRPWPLAGSPLMPNPWLGSLSMTTQHEQRADTDAEEWLQTLPPEIRAHTVSTQALKEHWITNSPKQLAVTFVDCVRQQAWDGIAYMPSVESKREVRHYTPLQWMRECIGAEPDELMRTVAGHLPNAEEASAAAITMIDLLKEEEPDTLRELCRDYRHGESNMLGWNSLFKMLQEADPVWAQAQAQLQEAVKGKPGRPAKAEENAAHRAANNPTNGASRKPKDRKSRLIRTLTNLKEDPEGCNEKGTTPERVQAALTKLVRGITPSVEAAKREAGIALPTKPAGGLGIRGAADDVARRIIATVGAEHARRIADAIHQQLT